MKTTRSAQGFTLIELLTVIAIIAVLMGLLFGAMGGVKDSGNKTKAKNDLLQIITATKAYYTEYGRYPLATTEVTDTLFGAGGTTNDNLFNVLRANGQGRDNPANDNLNPRRIVFLEAPLAKATLQRGGIIPDSEANAGQFFDPWGTGYYIAIDGDYDNVVKAASHAYSDTSFANVNTGVIAWSYGKDKKQGTAGDKKYAGSDDVISWQ